MTGKKQMICLLAGILASAATGTAAFAEETNTTENTLPEDIYSFCLKLDGEIYQFPLSYQEFTSRGWTYTDDETQELTPNSYSSSETFTKGDLQIYASVINLGINTLPVSECTIGGISMDEWQYNKAPDTTLELPGGIEYGVSTLEDVQDAYGTASSTYEGTLYTKLTYQYDYYQEISVYVSTETGVVNEIDLRNYVTNEEENQAAAAEVSDEPTEEVLAYTAPESIGDDLRSFTVEYAGDLYQLPAPVSVFEENGWTIQEENSESVVSGKSFGWVSMSKDNQTLRVIARNYNANAATIRNCFVTDVKGNVNSTNLPITIQKGITLGMSGEDVLTALTGEDYETDDSSDLFLYYTITGTQSSLDKVQILVNKEENQVTGIEVSYEPKTLE